MNLFELASGVFTDWLYWLMAGGSAMASSWVLERIKPFQALTVDGKKFVAYAVSAGIGLGAYALLTFAPEFVQQAEPFFKILAGVFGVVFLGNAFHALDKKKK